MEKDIYVSVSTDPIKDYQEIIDYAKEMQGKADFLHCDIMDGNFVSNKTFDSGLVYNINQNSIIMLDVHLMCDEPLMQIDDYLNAGANILTIHYEAFKDKNDIMDAITKIKEAHGLVGLSINPETPVKDIRVFIHDVDVILVMSVHPGMSGQKFLPEVVEKIKVLDQLRKDNSYNFKIEVDGGVNNENAQMLIDSGVDMLVSGSYVYKAHDREAAIESLKGNK